MWPSDLPFSQLVGVALDRRSEGWKAVREFASFPSSHFINPIKLVCLRFQTRSVYFPDSFPRCRTVDRNEWFFWYWPFVRGQGSGVLNPAGKKARGKRSSISFSPLCRLARTNVSNSGMSNNGFSGERKRSEHGRFDETEIKLKEHTESCNFGWLWRGENKIYYMNVLIALSWNHQIEMKILQKTKPMMGRSIFELNFR